MLKNAKTNFSINTTAACFLFFKILLQSTVDLLKTWPGLFCGFLLQRMLGVGFVK